MYPGAERRVNALADCNQWQQHDLQNFQGCQTARVSGRESPPWRGCWCDADAWVLVTLVVPGRLCRVCPEIKGDVLRQLQATCPCGTCCWLGLCSLRKNSCFLKWNESKAKGGKQKLQLRMKGKHRPDLERIPKEQVAQWLTDSGEAAAQVSSLCLGQVYEHHRSLQAEINQCFKKWKHHNIVWIFLLLVQHRMSVCFSSVQTFIFEYFIMKFCF